MQQSSDFEVGFPVKEAQSTHDTSGAILGHDFDSLLVSYRAKSLGF
jgi:hypothetical protein